MARGDVMPLQEEHDVLDFLLLDPALFDPFHTDFSDSRDLQQIVRRSLDHFQRILAEFLHDLFGVFWADPLHQPASQIFLYAVNGCRQGLLELLDRELPAVSGVHFPESAQIKNAPDMHIRHLADDRHEVLKVLCPALDDRVSVLGILIRDALDDAPQMFHALSPAFLSERLLNVRPRWRTGCISPISVLLIRWIVRPQWNGAYRPSRQIGQPVPLYGSTVRHFTIFIKIRTARAAQFSNAGNIRRSVSVDKPLGIG